MAKKTKGEEKKDATQDGPVAVNDAWTGLLIISLLALMTGAGFLFYDYMQYPADKDIKPPPKLTGSPPGQPQPPQQQPPPGAKDGVPPVPMPPMPPMPKQ